MHRRNTAPDDRGQSEVLSFIFVFGLVILAIALVTVFGVTALGEVRQASVADNGEFAMKTVEANMEELFYGTTTRQTTEVTVESASLETGAPVTVGIEGIGTSLPGGPVSKTLRPIVYRSGDADIAYENSMVLREQSNGGGVAVTDPLFKLSDRVSVVPVVQTVIPSSAGPQSVSGGTRQIRARTTGTERIVRENPSSGVSVRYTLDLVSPQRVDIWKRVLNEELDGVTDPSPSTDHCVEDPSVDNRLNCEFTTDRLVVSVVTIEYEIE